jgi:hypothetical protein
MRRLAAYLALSVVLAGLLVPFLAAAQLSTIHACCLRGGLHHCQRPSSEARFYAPRADCPYSTPLPFAAFTGLESAKFNLSTPTVARFVAHAHVERASGVDAFNWRARGPPVSLP